MAFTNQDLINIEKSIASGELRVKLGDKEVTYKSTAELIQVRSMIMKELQPTNVTAGRVYASVSKGY